MCKPYQNQTEGMGGVAADLRDSDHEQSLPIDWGTIRKECSINYWSLRSSDHGTDHDLLECNRSVRFLIGPPKHSSETGEEDVKNVQVSMRTHWRRTNRIWPTLCGDAGVVSANDHTWNALVDVLVYTRFPFNGVIRTTLTMSYFYPRWWSHLRRVWLVLFVNKYREAFAGSPPNIYCISLAYFERAYNHF